MKKLLYIIIGLLLAACYDDEGNYDYKEVNTLAISLDELIPVRLSKDTTFTLTPTLSQSLEENEDNLEFLWLHSTVNEFMLNHGQYDTVCQEKTLRYDLDPEDPELKYEHYFRLIVRDRITEVVYQRNVKIRIVPPYEGVWMVLHSKNGQTQLGSVEYISGNMFVQEDAYYVETGKRLMGKPLALMQYSAACRYFGTGSKQNMFTVITDDPKEAGIYCHWKHFQKMDSLDRMVYGAHKGEFDYSNVTLADGDGANFAFVLSGGKLFQTMLAGKYYKPDVDLPGEVNFTLGTKVTTSSWLYDARGHRFAYYYNEQDFWSSSPSSNNTSFSTSKENAWDVTQIPFKDGNVTEVDPNALPRDQKVLYIGQGYFPGGYWEYGRVYALAKNEDRCFVYEFDSDALSFLGYYPINIPLNLDENSCFASTVSYDGIMFYASGNTVYRLDFKKSGGQANVIYTHQGSKVTKMKFCRRCGRNDSNKYEAYEFDLKRSLGISFDMGDGTNEFVILNLSQTGNVGADSENYPAIQVHSGFGEITDFVFI